MTTKAAKKIEDGLHKAVGYAQGFKKAQAEGQVEIDRLTTALAAVWSAAADYGPMTTREELLSALQSARDIANSAIKRQAKAA